MNTKMNSLRALWITMRPYLLFVSGITGLSGMAVSEETAPLPLIALFAASFFAYGFGQALTDCFQMDTDAISAPYRPLVAGLVSRTTILAMSIIGLAACMAVFALRNPWNLGIGLAGAAGLGTYTFFKRRWWGGPWYNAWIVVALCLMGFLGGTGTRQFHVTAHLVPMLAAVFFGYANFVLSGYFKDISADAETGYNTLPVVFGRRTAAVASDLLAAGFLASTIWASIAILKAGMNPSNVIFALPFAGLGLAFIVAAQILLHRNRSDHAAHSPIAYVVHAYILMLSALISCLHPEWALFLAGHYGLFVYVLTHRAEVTQI
jgi:4-hydroxybenzoate polyprenyltransferase